MEFKLDIFILTNDSIPEDCEEWPYSLTQTRNIFNGYNPNLDIKIKSIEISCTEHKAIGNAFEDSRNDAYVIICKDTTVSSLSPSDLLFRISEVISTECFDVMWLAKWMDQCQKHSRIRKISDTGSYVVNTYSPHGTQCLLISPEGKRKLQKQKCDEKTNYSELLNRLVKAGKLKAITFQPSIVSYDVSRARVPLDYVKMCECADPPGTIKPDLPPAEPNVFIFLIIGIIILISIFILIRFGNHMTKRYEAFRACSEIHSQNFTLFS